MKAKILIIAIFLFPLLYISFCNQKPRVENKSSELPASLSAFGLFKGNSGLLHPADGVHIYELASPLFTDYAEKQRLIKLPAGKSMRLKGDGLLEFPEGTILAKTFFYSQAREGFKPVKKIIETRILRLTKGRWIAGTYQWNQAQNSASLTTDEVKVPVTFIDKKQRHREIAYKIPSNRDCISCHQSIDRIIPIGPKAMNLNISVQVEDKWQNQLKEFERMKLLEPDMDIKAVSTLPDYEDESISQDLRARAYLDINCSHCHNPTGFASAKSIILGYKAPLAESGISVHRNNIMGRMRAIGEFHMPKTGTTIIDEEGVALIERYLSSLPK